MHHDVVQTRGNPCGAWHSGANIRMTGNRVENVTCVAYPSAITYQMAWFEDQAAASGVAYRNDLFILGVFAGRDQSAFDPSSLSFTHENNLYWRRNGNGQGALGISLNASERYADPLLADLASANYHLLPGSPAIDAGAFLGYAADYDGRPLVGVPDVGAFEAQ
jgi:hypothetical protein